MTVADRSRHLIGLLLGAEEDWPRAFEALLQRVGPVTRTGPSTSSGPGG